MKDGFIRVCAATPDIRVADCAYNEKNIMNLMDEAYEKQVSVLVFPELCITGYTCGDLFLQDVLLKAAQDSLRHIVSHSAGKICLCLSVCLLCTRGSSLMLRRQYVMADC